MTPQEKLNALKTAYQLKTRNDGTEYYALNEGPLRDALLEIQNNSNFVTGMHDLDYEIMARASWHLVDECDTLEKLETFDYMESNTELASVYTNHRLNYLHQNNQDEISEIAKDCNCDIATAAATWYESKIAEAIEALKAYILSK